MKYLICLLLILFFILQYSFWFGKHGIYSFFYIKNKLKIEESCNYGYKLKIRNNQLLFEIHDLINNRDETIEERARSELNMIKSDENFYRLIPVDKN